MSLPQVTSAASSTSIVQTTENRNPNNLGLTIKSCANKTYEIMNTIISRIPSTITGAAIGAVTGAVSGGMLAHVSICVGTHEEKVGNESIQVPNPLFCSFDQVFKVQKDQASWLDVQNRVALGKAIVGAVVGGVLGGLRGARGNTTNSASVKIETEEFELEAITVKQTADPTTEETQTLIAKP